MKVLFLSILIIFLLFAFESTAQWEQTNGLANTPVFSLAVSGSSLFAGTKNGVYLTTDHGINWVEVNNVFKKYGIISLVYSDTNLFAAESYNGVFLSINNGISWAAVNNGLPMVDINCLFASKSYLFAGLFNNMGVYRSTNTGTN